MGWGWRLKVWVIVWWLSTWYWSIRGWGWRSEEKRLSIIKQHVRGRVRIWYSIWHLGHCLLLILVLSEYWLV